MSRDGRHGSAEQGAAMMVKGQDNHDIDRIPKKQRGGGAGGASSSETSNNTPRLQHEEDSGSAADRNKSNSKSKVKSLDPVAEARKALAMYEEVSGESSSGRDHGRDQRKKPPPSSHPKSTPPAADDKTPANERDSSLNKRRQQEEELERRRKRIREGEARRRAFKPKIAVVQDPSHLL
jgi:hypothetical protein